VQKRKCARVCDPNTVWPLRFLVIPFGLAKAPLVIMDLLNQVFHEYLDFGVVTFTNDMLVYLTNRVEHERHLVIVLEVLEGRSWSPNS
jgi:hypothetical protein